MCALCSAFVYVSLVALFLLLLQLHNNAHDSNSTIQKVLANKRYIASYEDVGEKTEMKINWNTKQHDHKKTHRAEKRRIGFTVTTSYSLFVNHCSLTIGNRMDVCSCVGIAHTISSCFVLHDTFMCGCSLCPIAAVWACMFPIPCVQLCRFGRCSSIRVHVRLCECTSTSGSMRFTCIGSVCELSLSLSTIIRVAWFFSDRKRFSMIFREV